MPSVRRQVLPFLSALLFCGMAPAQGTLEPSSAVGSQPQSQAGSPEPAATIRTQTNLVLVDVVVTENGQAVHGLDTNSFQTFEDGKPEKIVTFDDLSAPKPPTPEQTEAALPPNTYTNTPRYPVANAVDVILLDTLNTPLLERNNAERQLVRFLTQATPGTLIAVYSLGTKLTLETNFTTDPAALLQMRREVPARPQPTLAYDEHDNQTRMNDLKNAPAAVQSKQGILLDALLGAEARYTAEAMGTRVQLTLKAMEELADILQGLPGRKNLIWISGSFPLMLAPDTELKNPFDSMSSFGPKLESTARKLAAARVAVYTIDATGLVGLPSADATAHYSDNGGKVLSNGGVKIAGDSDDTKFLQRIADTHGTMRAIAHDTGGKAYLNTNGITEAIAAAVSNGQNYYTLGFIPSMETLDGGFHKLRVNIPGKSFELSYREGYLADRAGEAQKAPAARKDELTSATLHGAPPSRQVGLQVHILPITDPSMKGVAADPANAGDSTAKIKGAKTLYVADLLVDIQSIPFEVN